MRKGYGQFCPIAKASEIFATRWTPLVLRELMADIVVDNVAAILDGKAPPNCINPQVLK